MLKRRFPCFALLRTLLIKLSFLLLLSPVAFAQPKVYSYNQPGNPCYFSYLCFTRDSDYSSIKKPFIFILGKEGQSVNHMFEEDTLKNSSLFQDYKFIYLPNKGIDARNKLGCIESFVNLLTEGYHYGHVNLFFQVNDKSITDSDLVANGLKRVFKSIRYYNEKATISKQSDTPKNVSEDFKETAIVEGVNLVSKHTKPNAKHPQGGIVKKEAPVHISNLVLVDPSSGKATRIGRKRNESGELIRYSKKSGEEIK